MDKRISFENSSTPSKSTSKNISSTSPKENITVFLQRHSPNTIKIDSMKTLKSQTSQKFSIHKNSAFSFRFEIM